MNMTFQQKIGFLIIFLIVTISTVNAAAPIQTVSQGNTVFIGEQGLDITGALGGATQIGWWASGAAVATSSPDQTYSVSSPTNFFVSPSTFGSYTGNWYRLDNAFKVNGPAFNIVDPQLAVRVEDPTVSVDATNKWVPRGDQVSFVIDTNLIAMNQRGSSPQVTLYVQAPDGAQFSSLLNSAGNPTSISNILVTTSPFYLNSIWNTGNSMYAPGLYTIWAEYNVNGMKDNYGVTGKTISAQVTVLDQEQNPLIQSRTVTTKPSSTSTPSPTPTKTVATQTTTPRITQPLTAAPTPSISPTEATTSFSPTAPTATGIVPTPHPTKSPGFECIFGSVSVIFGFIVYIRKK